MAKNRKYTANRNKPQAQSTANDKPHHHNDNTEQGVQTESLTVLFGRIAKDPNKFGGNPFLKNTKIPVESIIACFQKGYSDTEIRKEFNNKLIKGDLDACRAYQVRFRPETLSDAFNIDPNNKFFMVDENFSYKALYKIAKAFGWSSHVGAEGFQGEGPNHDDEQDIWAHAIAEKYKAVLTSDCDFIGIALRHKERLVSEHGSLQNSPEHTPVVIHTDPEAPVYDIIRLLMQYKDDIKAFADQNKHVCVYLSKNGLELDMPEKVKRAIETKTKMCNPPSPPHP